MIDAFFDRYRTQEINNACYFFKCKKEEINEKNLVELATWIEKKRAAKLKKKVKRVKLKSILRVKRDKALISNAIFYKSGKFKDASKLIIDEFGEKCMCCNNINKNKVVHIKSRRKYPELELELSNLQILCEPCNVGKGNWDETDWRNK